MKSLFAIIVLILNNFNINAQSIFNQLDTAGKKEGFWKGVYEESKRPRYEGTFDHDKETGLFKFFDDSKTSNLVATREFNSKDNSAYTIFYDENKNKISEGKVLNKLYEGLWIYYHKATKTIMTSENYINGKLEGTKTINYVSGKVAEISNYKNGVRNGVYKKFTENGIELENSIYSNGELDGVSTFKAPDGLVVAKGLFKQGKKVGVWFFYENGKLVSKDDFNKPRKKFKKRVLIKNEN